MDWAKEKVKEKAMEAAILGDIFRNLHVKEKRTRIVIA